MALNPESADTTGDSVENSLNSTVNTPARVSYIAAALAFLLEFIHLWLIPTAFFFWPAHGVFFAVVAGFFGLLAVNLYFGSDGWTLRLGLFLCVFVLVIWGAAQLVKIVFPVWLVAVKLPIAKLDTVTMGLVILLLIPLLQMRRHR